MEKRKQKTGRLLIADNGIALVLDLRILLGILALLIISFVSALHVFSLHVFSDGFMLVRMVSSAVAFVYMATGIRKKLVMAGRLGAVILP